MYFKFFFFVLFSFIISCSNSIENLNVDELESPCDCLDAKLEIYKELLDIDENHFNLKEKDDRSIDLKDMEPFSKAFKLDQKIQEIDFKILLNSWSLDIQNCSNYPVFDSIRNTFLDK